MINLFATLAQEESNNRSYIVQFGIRIAQRKGKWTTGTPPYGYNIKDGFLVINELEAIVVQRIFNEYYNQGYGTGRICRNLNSDGIPTKKGKQWSQKQISTILDNDIYTGIQTTHTKQTIDINRQLQKLIPKEEQIIHEYEHLKIIDPELFQLVQIKRKKRKAYVRKDRSSKGLGYEWCCAINDMYGKASAPTEALYWKNK